MKEELSDYEKVRRVVYESLVLRISEAERHRAFVYYLSCGLGWAKEILKLAENIDRTWQGFEKKVGKECWTLLQAKEKFGGLRFYAQFIKGAGVDYQDRIDSSWALIHAAESACLKLCEKCGNDGKECHPNGNWVKTLCEACEKEIRGLKDMRVSCTGLG